MRGKGNDPPESMSRENPGASSDIAIQQRLESIFRAAPVGIGLVRSRIILEVNEKLCEMTGYTRDELTGKSALILYPSREEYDRVGREKYAQIERSGTGTIETVWKRKDGTLIDVLLSSSAVDRTDPDKGFTFSALDITEEKKVKAAEEANTSLLRIAGETARFGGWDVNLETNISTWSDTVCDIHGMPRGFAPKVEKGIEFYAPEYRETITRVFKACAKEGIPYSEELEIIDGNGCRVWVKTIGKPVRDENGIITGVHGSFQDISHQKKAGEQLLKSKERMDFLLKATNTSINIMDSDHTLTFVDERWQSVYGDFSGKKCYSYFMGREEPCDGCGIPEALETGEVVVAEEYLPKEDRFVEVHTIPFQNREGSWQLAEFNIDITKRKRAEEEREKLRFQLIQARKLESVGRLAGGVAHDFNNMLGVILGNAEMTLERLDPSMPIYQELTEIRNAARRSADLTRQLLTFARKQTIAPRLIDLNETVEGMLQMLRRLVGENITLNWKPGEALHPVKLDPSQFDQLLANLVVNARDAITDVGTITIETGYASMEDVSSLPECELLPENCVTLSIADNGCGMDEETRLHIFEPFYTTKETGGGTGLGLATVYGIVRQNDGFIDVRSRSGEGTVIRVFLPCRSDDTVEHMESTNTSPAEEGSETILIVEDESSVLKMTKTMLESLGYNVIAAEAPGKALQLAGESDIDLLLTDVVMPEMNGRELAERLTGERPNLKCLFMSGYTADVMAQNSMLSPREGLRFIQKPFTVKELAEAVRKAIDNS